MIRDKVFLLFPFCKLVKGYKRSAIYDLEKQKLHLISNEVYTVIAESNGKTLDEIYNMLKGTDKLIVDSLITSLLDKRLISFVKKEDYKCFLSVTNFPVKKSLLDNFIVDIDVDSDYDLFDALCKIDVFHLQVIQLRFLYAIDYDSLIQIVEKTYITSAEAIQLVMPFETINKTDSLHTLLDNYQNITNVYFWDCPIDKTEDYKQCQITYLTKEINSSDSCGVITEKHFLCNKKFYFEAQNRNTCLSKKCSIDRKGVIKNCPYMEQEYGYINQVTANEFQDIVKSPLFVSFSAIKKDDIKTCSVCEFRYACFDCRAFISEKDNLFSKPSKCTYNPYFGIWEKEDIAKKSKLNT